jgi:hypothetical protein
VLKARLVEAITPETQPSVGPEEIHAVLLKNDFVLERAWRELGLKDRYVLRRLMKRYTKLGWTFTRSTKLGPQSGL